MSAFIGNIWFSLTSYFEFNKVVQAFPFFFLIDLFFLLHAKAHELQCDQAVDWGGMGESGRQQNLRVSLLDENRSTPPL